LDVFLLALRVLLALLLYGFLAALAVLLWRDLCQSVSVLQIPPPDGKLAVVDTGGAGIESAAAFRLQEVTSLGRAPDNIVVLPHAFVSAHHALLTWRQGRWWLEDLGSKNGTALDGETVTRPTVVGAGGIIGIGGISLRLEVERE
jgi:hypothetical protein